MVPWSGATLPRQLIAGSPNIGSASLEADCTPHAVAVDAGLGEVNATGYTKSVCTDAQGHPPSPPPRLPSLPSPSHPSQEGSQRLPSRSPFHLAPAMPPDAGAWPSTPQMSNSASPQPSGPASPAQPSGDVVPGLGVPLATRDTLPPAACGALAIGLSAFVILSMCFFFSKQISQCRTRSRFGQETDVSSSAAPGEKTALQSGVPIEYMGTKF